MYRVQCQMSGAQLQHMKFRWVEKIMRLNILVFEIMRGAFAVAILYTEKDIEKKTQMKTRNI